VLHAVMTIRTGRLMRKYKDLLLRLAI